MISQCWIHVGPKVNPTLANHLMFVIISHLCIRITKEVLYNLLDITTSHPAAVFAADGDTLEVERQIRVVILLPQLIQNGHLASHGLQVRVVSRGAGGGAAPATLHLLLLFGTADQKIINYNF